MSEWNHDILVENIRKLLKHEGMTQQQLAEVAGMTQANVSKALNSNDKRNFTLEQVIRISQHFGVSLDKLVGNKAAEQVELSTRSILAFLVNLLRNDIVRSTKLTLSEEVFVVDDDPYSNPSSSHSQQNIDYPAFYFPSYFRISELAKDNQEMWELYSDFSQCGNETKYLLLNDILDKIIPIIKLYRAGDISDEALEMILEGYLNKLTDK